MSKTIEQRTAQAVLQQPDTLVIAGHKVKVYPPTIGSLILASADISLLPAFDTDDKDIMRDTLRIARDCQPVASAIASLIVRPVGAFSGGLKHLLYTRRKRRMTRLLLEKVSAKEQQELLVKLLSASDVSSFFGTTTFLAAVNITKATKVVSTTASGQR